MIHVLSVISQLHFGGGENRLFHLARAIDRRRFRFQVVTLYGDALAPGTSCGSMQRQFADAGVEVVDLGLSRAGPSRAGAALRPARTAARLAAAIARLRRLAVESRADVVDAHLETALYTAVPAAASAGIPAVATLYSELQLWRERDGRSYRRLLWPPLRRLDLRLCSAVLTDSAVRAEELRQFVGPASPPLHVIPNGVRLDPPSRPRSAVLEELGIPPATRATIVGQVAGLVPFKGQAVLLEAAARVLAAGHDLYVLCVGDARHGPEYPDRLRALATSLGIAGRVRIGPYAGNIADVWSVIDVHAHPSSIDSLPNAVIEGMSLGKPAVVSSVGALPEHVEHGETGLVVPPDDPGALADALRRLVADPARARRLGEGARARYLEKFTPEVTARQIEGVFERLAGARGARRAG